VRWVVFALLGCVLWAPGGRAEERPKTPPEIRMQEVEIRGEVERPGVFYVIPRRPTPLDLGPRTRDFRPEILEPLLPEGEAGRNVGTLGRWDVGRLGGGKAVTRDG